MMIEAPDQNPATRPFKLWAAHRVQPLRKAVLGFATGTRLREKVVRIHASEDHSLTSSRVTC